MPAAEKIPPTVAHVATTAPVVTAESDATTPVAAPVVTATAAILPSARFIQHRDKNGRLTRDGMEHVIRNGGSVFVDGRTDPVTDVTQLPTAAQLAKGDPVAEKAAAADLQRQMAELQRQMGDLSGQITGGKKTATDLATVTARAEAAERAAAHASDTIEKLQAELAAATKK